VFFGESPALFLGLFCGFGWLLRLRGAAYRGDIADFFKVFFGIQGFLRERLASGAEEPFFYGSKWQFEFLSHL